MPTYVYDILGTDGEPTGERFEVFQHMREDALAAAPDGRPCRRAIVAGAKIVMGRPKERIRWKNPGEAVHNPHHADPRTSDWFANDDREGVIVGNVREHEDGTITTMDKRPIIRNRDDSKRFVEREVARGILKPEKEKTRRPVAKNLARRNRP